MKEPPRVHYLSSCDSALSPRASLFIEQFACDFALSPFAPVVGLQLIFCTVGRINIYDDRKEGETSYLQGVHHEILELVETTVYPRASLPLQKWLRYLNIENTLHFINRHPPTAASKRSLTETFALGPHASPNTSPSSLSSITDVNYGFTMQREETGTGRRHRDGT